MSPRRIPALLVPPPSQFPTRPARSPLQSRRLSPLDGESPRAGACALVVPTAPLFPISVDQVDGIVADILVEICAVCQARRITTGPPAKPRRVIPRAVVVQSVLLVPL